MYKVSSARIPDSSEINTLIEAWPTSKPLTVIEPFSKAVTWIFSAPLKTWYWASPFLQTKLNVSLVSL